MVERRDHVRTTFFSFLSFIAPTFFIRWSSTNGPLARDLPIVFYWPPALSPGSSSLLRFSRDDKLVRPLVIPRLESARRLAPRRHRMTAARGFSFTAAMRMIHRIHGNAAIVRHLAHPTLASRLAQADVFMLDVAHLPDGRRAFHQHFANLP